MYLESVYGLKKIAGKLKTLFFFLGRVWVNKD